MKNEIVQYKGAIVRLKSEAIYIKQESEMVGFNIFPFETITAEKRLFIPTKKDEPTENTGDSAAVIIVFMSFIAISVHFWPWSLFWIITYVWLIFKFSKEEESRGK